MTRWLRPHWLILMAILLLGAKCTQAPAPQDVAKALGEAAPLLPLYEALDALQTSGRTPVALLQIGDSHTANDAFSGRMRELFQTRFGDAGRGMLPPGIPFKYYRPAQVAVTASNWQTISSLTPAAPGPFGISGLRQAATGPAEMTLQATSASGLGKVVVECPRPAGRPARSTPRSTPGNRRRSPPTPTRAGRYG